MGFREDISYIIFYFLRAIPPPFQICVAAVGAFRGHRIGETAVMAGQLVHVLMVS